MVDDKELSQRAIYQWASDWLYSLIPARRCEIPTNSFVEFVRVIWPGGTTNYKNALHDSTAGGMSSHDHNGGRNPARMPHLDPPMHNVWDIFNQTISNSKSNITEIVARFREDLARKPHNIMKRLASVSISPVWIIYFNDSIWIF